MENLNQIFFRQQRRANVNNRPISPVVLHQLGLPIEDKFVVENTLEDLKKTVPRIVVGECVVNAEFQQNFFKFQNIIKKQKYVMSAGVYQQLQYNPVFKQNKQKVLKPANIKFKNIYKPYYGESLDNKTLFVSRTGGIGDLCFIQPNLLYLKETYPSSTIKFACGPQYQDMIRNWDCIDEVLDLPSPFSAFFSADYHAIFEGVIERCKEAETNNAYELFTRWLNLNLSTDRLVPKQNPIPEIVEECKEILKEWNLLDEPFLITQIRASSPIRTPSYKFWIKLFDKLTSKGHKIIIADSPFQESNIESFIKMVSKPEMLFNFTKKSSNLQYLIAMVSLSKMSISTDSALIHIAQSLDIPSFGFYGPFPGKIRLSTYHNVDWIDAKMECAPCFIHSSNPCKHSIDGSPPCYNNINLDEAVERIEGLLKNV
jgi:ADP-heptose:LPS heptosyltransferase